MGAESQTKNVPDNHSNFGTFTTPQQSACSSFLCSSGTVYWTRISRQKFKTALLSILKGKAHGTETYLLSPTNRVNCFSCLNFYIARKMWRKMFIQRKSKQTSLLETVKIMKMWPPSFHELIPRVPFNKIKIIIY